jgi:hypothetical protein
MICEAYSNEALNKTTYKWYESSQSGRTSTYGDDRFSCPSPLRNNSLIA